MRYFLILILIFTGCASSTIYRDDEGRVRKIKNYGNIKTVYEKDGEKVETDSKVSDIFQNMVNLNKL